MKPEGKFFTILREGIDFINIQVGVYTAACSGFAKNKSLIERQVMRITRPVRTRKPHNSETVVVHTSLEDPNLPEVIHHRIVRANDYIVENSVGGIFEQQQCQAILIFIYDYWENYLRSKLAESNCVDKNSIKSDLMNDLRIIRQAILHKRAVLVPSQKSKMKSLGGYFSENQTLVFSHEIMHRIFSLIKNDFLRLLRESFPDNRPAMEVNDLAIQLR